MQILLIISLALAPSLAIGLFVYIKDKYEREPLAYILLAFAFGCLSILPAIGIELGFQYLASPWAYEPWYTAVYALAVVGCTEELLKFAALRYFYRKQQLFNEPMDGIVYAVFISLGFATIENLMYSFNGGVEVAILRIFTAVPAHGVFAILMGYYVGKARFSPQPFGLLFRGAAIACVMHGLYDYFLFQEISVLLRLLSLLVLGAGMILSFRAIRHHQKASPFKRDGLS